MEQRVYCLSYCKVTHMLQFFLTSNVQFVRHAAGRLTQAGNATDQWYHRWNAAITCPTQRQPPASAGWLSWIVDVDKPSVEGHPKQRNRLDSSPGCLGPNCEARWTWRSHSAGRPTSVCSLYGCVWRRAVLSLTPVQDASATPAWCDSYFIGPVSESKRKWQSVP